MFQSVQNIRSLFRDVLHKFGVPRLAASRGAQTGLGCWIDGMANDIGGRVVKWIFYWDSFAVSVYFGLCRSVASEQN